VPARVPPGRRRPRQPIQVAAAGKVYLIAAGYHDVKLGLEFHGGHHQAADVIAHDEARDAALRAAGWTMLYFDKPSTPSGVVHAVRTERERLLRAKPHQGVALRGEVG